MATGDKLVTADALKLVYDSSVNTSNIANNLNTTTAGKVLDARQGKALNDSKLSISNVANNLTTTDSGKALDARMGKSLNDSKVNVSDIANNVTTTATGKVLDASQGKVLNDRIALKVNTSDIVNNLTTSASGKVLDARQGPAITNLLNAKVNTTDVANNLTTTSSGKVLDARMGKSLNDSKVNVSDVANNVTTTASGKVLDARQGKALSDRINSSAAEIRFSSSVSTWASVYEILSTMPLYKSATFFCPSDVSSFLTDSQVGNFSMRGVVSQTSSGFYDFFASTGSGDNIFAWRISGLSSSSATPTVGRIYRYMGASSIEGARTNLSVYSKTETDSAIQQSVQKLNVVFGENDTTWSAIYSKISTIQVNGSAFFLALADTIRVLSGNAASIALKGMINRPSSGTYDIMAYTGYQPQYIWVWRITNLSSASSTPTVGTVYRFTGTAIQN